jgi:hypothetical protein
MNDFAARCNSIQIISPILHHLLTLIKEAGAVVRGIASLHPEAGGFLASLTWRNER